MESSRECLVETLSRIEASKVLIRNSDAFLDRFSPRGR
jgi:hypothetical protein